MHSALLERTNVGVSPHIALAHDNLLAFTKAILLFPFEQKKAERYPCTATNLNTILCCVRLATDRWKDTLNSRHYVICPMYSESYKYGEPDHIPTKYLHVIRSDMSKCYTILVNQLIRFPSTLPREARRYISMRATPRGAGYNRVRRTSSNFRYCKSYIFIISQRNAYTGRYPSTREAINCEGKHGCQQVMYCSQRREKPFITLRWGNSHELWSHSICINEGTA